MDKSMLKRKMIYINFVEAKKTLFQFSKLANARRVQSGHSKWE